MSSDQKRWRYTAGTRPYRVAVLELIVGGVLNARRWLLGEGRFVHWSLGHRDRARAIEYAETLARQLREGAEAVSAGHTTITRAFRLYRANRSVRKKPATQKEDERRSEMWLYYLPDGFLVEAFSFAIADGFVYDRHTGAIDARGRPVPPEFQRPVSLRAVEADLRGLKAVFNWAITWKTPDGRRLITENPLDGYEIPREKNPRRPIATQDRFEKIRAVSNTVLMTVVVGGRRVKVRSYLSEILVIVVGTGRRISAVLQLTFDDLLLHQGPYGTIRWPASTDKQGVETTVPIGPDVRAAIDRIMAERAGIGAVPLFPAPRDPSKPVRYELASAWLKKAEQLAGVPKQEGGLWHPYRRKWATERKHLSPVDVAAAGGWSNTRTLTEIYQQPDQESMLEVVLEAGQLREHGS